MKIKTQSHSHLKRLLFAVLFCLGSNLSFAQSNESVILPSPRSREFEKFINYKVSLYNGLAETNLNFYNIELDGVSIPIGIAYHASGIKFGQISGDVGLGWQLNPDYRVSRTVYGRVDEAYTMPDMNNVSGGLAIGPYLSSGFATPFDRDLYLARYMYLSPGGENPPIAASQNDYMDSQFDMFTIGLPGQNGNFIITDRANKVLTMLNNAALGKLNYSLSNGIISELNATDGNAVRYKFGKADTDNEGRQVSVNGVMVKCNTGWMLSEINTPFDNTIDFQYQTISETSEGLPSYSREILEGRFENSVSLPSCYATIDNNGVTSLPTSTNYDSKILSTITTPNEVVTFNRNLNGTVSSIVITKPGGAQIKKITFVYSQPASRVFLDEIHISGTGTTVVEKYKFDYTTKNISFRNYDCFGYNINNAGGGSDYANQFGRFDFSRVDIVGLDCTGPNGDYVNLIGLDKVSYPASDDGMLKKLTFPTGGTREFFYTRNEYKISVNPFVLSGGGFRISAITSTDGTGGPEVIRNYYYGDGIRMIDPSIPSMALNQKVVLANFTNGGIDHIRALKRTIQNSIINSETMEAVNQSNNGWYNKVTEDYGEGKIEYTFDIPLQYVGLDAFPTNAGVASIAFPSTYLNAYHLWNEPYLKEAITFKGTGTSGYTAVQKENYEYYLPSLSPSDEFVGLKISPFALIRTGYNVGVYTFAPPFSLYDDSGLQSVFNYATYTVTRGDVQLKKKITTNYDPAGSELVTSSEFTYTSFNLVASEKTTNSKAEVSLLKNKYPFNYPAITGTDNTSAGIKKLAEINAVNKVIERSTYVQNQDGSNNRLAFSSFHAYKPTLPVPEKIFETEFTVPLTDFAESSVSAGVVTKDSRYREHMSFDQYNTKGKILQRGKPGDTKEVYFWGYKGQYPVAKITGSDYATASGYINQTILDNTTGSYSDSDMRTELNKLRAIPNTLVSTYTYSPLVGLTSMTDPGGKSTLYDYDSFSRLVTIKNGAGQAKASYCYNYAGQVVDCPTINPTSVTTPVQLALLVGTVPLPDLSPTLEIDNLSFPAGVSRDFIVNLYEINNVTTTGSIKLRISKLSSFNITYPTLNGTSHVLGGIANENSNWTFTENSGFITATSKPGVTIAANGQATIGFTIARKSGTSNGTQNITAVIIAGSGGEIKTTNNSTITSVTAN
ncbi:hypothetical protein [Dyadobacter sp. 32]|uniref:RHS repeat protein n=1 Tax=Dyadobacter sp. 32 TaxID=538966 RepID=UPI0039C71243